MLNSRGSNTDPRGTLRVRVKWESSADLRLYTDAAGGIGFRGFAENNGFKANGALSNFSPFRE